MCRANKYLSIVLYTPALASRKPLQGRAPTFQVQFPNPRRTILAGVSRSKDQCIESISPTLSSQSSIINNQELTIENSICNKRKVIRSRTVREPSVSVSESVSVSVRFAMVSSSSSTSSPTQALPARTINQPWPFPPANQLRVRKSRPNTNTPHTHTPSLLQLVDMVLSPLVFVFLFSRPAKHQRHQRALALETAVVRHDDHVGEAAPKQALAKPVPDG